MTSKIFLIPEVLYSQRGYIRPPSIFDPPRSTDIVINCLESPVLISYFPMKFMAIEIGPNMAVKLFTYNRTAKVSMRDEFYKFDFGISGGLRFNIMDNWSVMSRYYYGITPIYEIDTIVRGQYPAKGSMYSRNFQVSIAYTFQFKAKE